MGKEPPRLIRLAARLIYDKRYNAFELCQVIATNVLQIADRALRWVSKDTLEGDALLVLAFMIPECSCVGWELWCDAPLGKHASECAV